MRSVRFLSAAMLAAQLNIVAADTFNTLELAERSANIECLDWCITGICFWLVCTPFPPSCSIQTTPQISHNLPDLVAMSYDQPGDMPWTELQATLGEASNAALSTVTQSLLGVEAGGGSYMRNSGALNRTSFLRYKDATVVGNPATAITSKVPWLCKSNVKPLFPYFMSEIDALSWRSGIPDMFTADALIPGKREVGPDIFRTWGGVYPRSGFLHQAIDPRAGAVIAQRAIDIVTRVGQPHIYVPYGHDDFQNMTWGDRNAKSQEECKESGGRWNEDTDNNIRECLIQTSVQRMPGSNEKTDQWQMISPKVDQSCGPFGDPNGWDEGRESEDGRYAWLYWRPYECCIPGPGIYLNSVSIPPVCIKQ